MGKLDRQLFIKKQRELLEVEQNEEIDQIKSLLDSSSAKYLEELGLCVRKLQFSGESGGLFGKRIATFVLESATRKQKKIVNNNSSTMHIFGPGDIVAVFRSGEDDSQTKDAEKTKEGKPKKNAELSGVVYRVSHDSLVIAFDDERMELDDGESIEYHAIKLTNDLTFRRMRAALDRLACDRFRSSSLVDALFGEFDSTAARLELNDLEFSAVFKCSPETLPFANGNLDESQRDAVRFALRQRYVAIVHGPPGTGKTTTLIEIISQLVRSGQKVLACAPSNVAVDNLAERLVDSVTRQIVRIGHPARTNVQVQAFTLDALLSDKSEVDAARLCADVRAELDSQFVALRRAGRDRSDRIGIRERISELRKELRQREKAAIRHVLGDADVVLATLTSAGDDGPLRCLADQERFFDVVLIDECSQAIEAACWIAATWARKLVIAGDHLQLPPTVVSRQAAQQGLSVSLMERLLHDTFAQQPSQFVRMLTVQYRMHQTIMDFSSHQLYANQLTAAPCVRSHLLRDLHPVHNRNAHAQQLAEIAFLYIDTADCGLNELQDSADARVASNRRDRQYDARRALDGTQSKANVGECELVYRHVAALVHDVGLNEHDIAVMSPYNRQVDLLRAALSERFANVEVRTIDAFQGREKEAVVLSLVRSNDQAEIGFLADRRRLNVAITRARRHLCVIADSDTLRGRPDCDDQKENDDESDEKLTREAYRLGRAFLRAFVDYCECTDSVHFWTPTVYTAVSSQDAGVTELDSNVAFQRMRDKLSGPSTSRSSAARTRANAKTASAAASSANSNAAVIKKASSTTGEAVENNTATTDTRLNQLRATVGEFVLDANRSRLEFSVALSSYERFLLHSLAEETDLSHTSVGDAENRRIVLFKRDRVQNEQQSRSSHFEVSDYVQEASEEPEESEDTSNQCEPTPQTEVDQNNGATGTTVEKKKKKKKKPKSAASAQNAANSVCTVDVESALERAAANGNDDALLAEAKRLNERCNVIGCRERDRHALIGATCRFCGKRFCVQHAIPELHGCGDAAKTDARAAYRKQMLAAGATCGSSTASASACGTSGRSPGCYGLSEEKSAIRREYLQRKLDKKLDKLGASRKAHTKDSNSKK